jgi:KDO2-lipid IV(A) lauroyltransferase
VAPWSKRHVRALDNLARALPERTRAEHEAIARTMWENLGRNFAEAFFLPKIAAEERISYVGLEAFERWASASGGRVACSGHLANWELAILGIMRRGLAPWSIYQRIKNPDVDRDVRAMRSFLYTGGIVVKNPGVPRQFMRILREGGTIAFMADLRDFTGADVPFFGRPAPSTTFPALLAHTAGTPILVSCMRRLPGVRFVQTYELVEVVSTGDRKADIVTATAQVQQALERFIRDFPEQWMWAHRRWG